MTEQTLDTPQRSAGQDIYNIGQAFSVPETPRVGHKADADAWRRSSNKRYKRKIERQGKAKGK